MIRKLFFFVTALLFSTMTSFSQTIKENIEKQSKDPKTAENAAKADVYILNNKKKITDTVSAKKPSNASTNTTRKKKPRRKS